MKLFHKAKDGGQESNVTGYWLIESKKLFSIVLLRFEGKSRENYHSHAFNAWTWFIKGTMVECFPDCVWPRLYKRSLLPKVTKRNHFHKVNSVGVSWALSIRGPWHNKWQEFNPITNEMITMTHGRIVINEQK